MDKLLLVKMDEKKKINGLLRTNNAEGLNIFHLLENDADTSFYQGVYSTVQLQISLAFLSFSIPVKKISRYQDFVTYKKS